MPGRACMHALLGFCLLGHLPTWLPVLLPCCSLLPSGGRYQFLLEMPVSASHVMQVTGKDEYLLIVSEARVGLPNPSQTYKPCPWHWQEHCTDCSHTQ